MRTGQWRLLLNTRVVLSSLFLTVLSLLRCVQTLSWWGACTQGASASVVVVHGLSGSRRVTYVIFLDRGSNPHPLCGQWIPAHWTTRGSSPGHFYKCEHTQASVISIGHHFYSGKILHVKCLFQQSSFYVESPFNKNTAFATMRFQQNNSEEIMFFEGSGDFFPKHFQ